MCNQINVCRDSIGSILITIPVRNVILRISFIIDNDGIISKCTTGSIQRCMVIILCPCWDTKISRNFSRRKEQVVTCFLCEILGMMECIKHWIQLMLNMKDVVLIIQIIINDCFHIVCATRAKVSNHSRENELLNIPLAVWLTITRHFQELCERAIEVNLILIKDVSSNFFCDIVAVFPDQDTSVSENIRIRCKDF